MANLRTYSIHQIHKWRLSIVLVVSLFLFTSLMVACKPTVDEGEATATPNPTPTPAPLGDPANPVIWGLVAPGDLQMEAASILMGQISARTGYTIQPQAFPTYQSLLGAMNLNHVQLSFLPPLTLLYAQEINVAQAAMLTNHFGVYLYGMQFFANVDSGFTPYFDTNTNTSTAQANVALAQFDGKRPCLIRMDSLTGGILPQGYFFDAVISTKDPVITQTTTGMIRALYIKNVCDFGATFAISGDPRTATGVQTDLPDVTQRVITIWQSDPIIPNLTLAYQPSLPTQYQDAITNAWIESIRTPEGKELLSEALGYSVQDMRVIDPSILEPLRLLVESSGANLISLIGN